MISDYSDTDEGALSYALQQFDLLSNTLSEYHLPTSPNAPQNVSTGVPTPAGAMSSEALFINKLVHHLNLIHMLNACRWHHDGQVAATTEPSEPFSVESFWRLGSTRSGTESPGGRGAAHQL